MSYFFCYDNNSDVLIIMSDKKFGGLSKHVISYLTKSTNKRYGFKVSSGSFNDNLIQQGASKSCLQTAHTCTHTHMHTHTNKLYPSHSTTHRGQRLSGPSSPLQTGRNCCQVRKGSGFERQGEV